MGVTGLWRLVEPSGKPVPLETLENKVLAIDVSIWLHQAIKGFQDAQGGALPNAHLLGIYHRVCKLLYFRIKPIFVFDGGVPHLKKETIVKRQQQRSKKITEAERIQKQLLTTLLKHTAVKNVLSEKTKATLTSPKTSPTKAKDDDNLYKLPPTDFASNVANSDEETSASDYSPTKTWDLHTINEQSEHFKSLPADVRHDILTDLKETRKQSSWGKIHEMPKNSGDFSGFQMKRLLKRYSVQVSLEEAAKEMGGHSLSLAELESLLNDQGVVASSGKRIASDENARYLLIKDLKQAMEDAKLQEVKKSPVENVTEYKKSLEAAIQLSLQDVPGTSKTGQEATFIENFCDGDFQSSSDDSDIEETIPINKNLAKNYMVEYSGLTPTEIDKIIGKNKVAKKKCLPVVLEDNQQLHTDKLQTNKNVLENKSGLLDHFDENNVANKDSLLVVLKNKHLDANTNNTQTNKDALVNNSDSSDDDFLEVSENAVVSNKEEKKKFEIFIETNKSAPDGDDLFSDIFTDSVQNAVEPEDTQITDILSSKEAHNISILKDDNETNKAIPNNNKISIETLESAPSNDATLNVADIELNDNTNIVKNILNNKLPNEEHSDVLDTKSQTGLNAVEPQKNTNRDETVSKTNVGIEDANLVEVFQNKQHDEDTLPPDVGSENDAANNETIVTSSNEIAVIKNRLTTDELEDMAMDLRNEKRELEAGRLTNERLANNLTDQIYQEAQELLQLFGVPYIVAPMEAEAQCAFLNSINLTDGTITDDSDIWLFGGKTVYKNFFNQRKHVLEYRLEQIQQDFKLTREQMILLALLVGSDYTTGLQGVGPVTALEIIAKFPPTDDLVSGLSRFRKWLSADKATQNITLRNKLKNVIFTEGFPSLQVVKAYLDPSVDTNEETFSWARPDIDGLKEFARQKFGWNSLKSDEILKPVVKRLNENITQRSIKEFFQTKHKIYGGDAEAKMSKRVKKAVEAIGKGEDNTDEAEEVRPKTSKKKQPEESGLQVLKKTLIQSKKRVKQIKAEIIQEIKKPKVPRVAPDLHKPEIIPQKEQDKVDAVRSRLKAIEVLRKSKSGPGYVKKRKPVVRKLKVDAELSESSSD